MIKCAFYEKEITPPLESEIPGYFNPRPAEDVQDRLYAKAMVIENDGETIAMVMADACGLSKAICDKITSRVERMTGIEAKNIMVTATHSHTAIPTGSGTIVAADEMYLDVFCRVVADCITLAQKRLTPAKIKYAKGSVEGISFVRNFRMKDGTIKTNPGRNNPDVLEPYDVPDYDFPLLIVYDENNKPLGSLTNFACHLDCIGSRNYSGDYASVLSYEMKKEFGDDFVSCFVMGTSGNINHVNPFATEPRKPDHYVMMGRKLAEEAKRIIPTAEDLGDIKLSSSKEVIRLVRRTISDEELEKEKEMASRKEVIDATSTDRSLGVCYRGYIAERIVQAAKDKAKTRDFVLQVITIGDVKIYGLAGEIYVTFGRAIKKNAPTEKVFIATLSNGSNGYVPTADLFDQDNMYEVRISSANFDADTGDRLVAKLKEMQ